MIQDSLQLPNKIERILEMRLRKSEEDLYQFFKTKAAEIAAGLVKQGMTDVSNAKDANTVTLLNFLRRICNGGEDLLPQSALEIWRSRSNGPADWQTMQGSDRKCDVCGSSMAEVDSLSDECLDLDCQHLICATCLMQADDTAPDEVGRCPKCAITQVLPRNGFSSSEASTQFSTKIEVLIRNLTEEQNLKQNETNTPVVKRYPFQKFHLVMYLFGVPGVANLV